MKKILALIFLALLLFCGWYFASPWLAMKGLVDAARANDVAELEPRVDFPAMRASVSDQISEATQRRAGQGDGLFAEIGGALAEEVGRTVVERALTPENVGNLVVTGSLAAGLLPERLRGQAIDWDVERESFNTFRASGRFEDGTGGASLIFVRDGLGWKLTGIDLPDL